MINSRTKGKVGELELAHYLTECGFPSRRGQQFKGGAGSPDVLAQGLEDFHIECKRVEKGTVYEWLSQAKAEAGGKIPVVMHRRSRKEWVAILPLDKFLLLVRENF